MISWIHGQRVDTWQQGLRTGVVIACSGLGYEIQVLPRLLNEIIDLDELTLWVHQIQRDDDHSMYGFLEKEQRDLFRSLIAVNGIGAQMAMALLQEIKTKELIDAITKGDLKRLSKAQGVGKKTAERLVVELRNKLSRFDPDKPNISHVEKGSKPSLHLELEKFNELQNTLTALGYEEHEIQNALNAVAKQDQPKTKSSSRNTDEWLKAMLIWLSQEAA